MLEVAPMVTDTVLEKTPEFRVSVAGMAMATFTVTVPAELLVTLFKLPCASGPVVRFPTEKIRFIRSASGRRSGHVALDDRVNVDHAHGQ